MSGFLREPKKVSNGRGQRPRPEKVSKASAQRGPEVAPVKQTVGFNPVNERLLFVAQVLIGYPVQVMVKNGIVYEGIFHALQVINKEVNIVLKWAKVVADPTNPNPEPFKQAKPVPTLIVYFAHFVHLTAKDIKMGADDVGPVTSDDFGFGTDAAIGKGRGGLAGRELQRWDAPEEDESLEDLQLEDGGRQWDQFEVNKKLFGVETSFDEALYTTKLDKNKVKISVAEATRLAREIEASNASSNLHMLEERGMLVDDSGVTEEDLYSAVLRQEGPGDNSSNDRTEQFNEDDSEGTSSRPAWATPSATGTAVAGRELSRKSSWEPGKRSVPIDVPLDHRKEANKLRMQLTTAKKERSPFGTPKGTRSPLASPLVGNAAIIEALDLNPGIPKIDQQTLQEFKAFKQKEVQNRLNKEQELRFGELRNQTGRNQHVSVSPENRTSDPPGSQASSEVSKDFSDKFGLSSKGDELGTGLSVCSSKSSLLDGSQQELSISATENSKGVSRTPHDTNEVNGVTESPPVARAAPNGEPKLKSTLNVNAKEFKFNPNAKEFKPGVGWGPAGGGGGGGAPPPASSPAPVPSSSSTTTVSASASAKPTASPAPSSSVPPSRKDFHPRSNMSSSPVHIGPVHMPMPQAMAGGWMPQQFLPGQFIAPMVGGSPQQAQMMYAVRPPFGPAGGQPYIAMAAGSPYGMVYASQMAGGAGGRPPMYGAPFQMPMGGMPGIQMGHMGPPEGISDAASTPGGKARE